MNNYNNNKNNKLNYLCKVRWPHSFEIIHIHSMGSEMWPRTAAAVWIGRFQQQQQKKVIKINVNAALNLYEPAICLRNCACVCVKK